MWCRAARRLDSLARATFRRFIFWALAYSALLLSGKAFADEAALTPSADTSIISVLPDNNLGGTPFVPSGTTQNYTLTRGLFRFNLTADVPRGSMVTGARL